MSNDDYGLPPNDVFALLDNEIEKLKTNLRKTLI